MLLRKKEEIEYWLNQYKIKKYKLVEDEEYGYIINVSGSVDLSFNLLKSIDVKFNNINGNFDCSNNELTLLQGSPKFVGGAFYCYNNKLKTLKECPKNVRGIFNCNNNQLISLEFIPDVMNGSFYCNNNKLIMDKLIYLPSKIQSNYIDISLNEDLKDLAKLTNFNKLKEKLNIYFEKENLLNIINKEGLSVNKKINKI